MSWVVSTERIRSELGPHHNLELLCQTAVPNPCSCHSWAWQGHPGCSCSAAGWGHQRHPAKLLFPLRAVTGGTAGAGSVSRWQCLCALLCPCWWLLLSPLPNPGGISRTLPWGPTTTQGRKSPAARPSDAPLAGFPSPFSLSVPWSWSSHPPHLCSQPRPGRAEALTKIAN